MYVIAVNKSQEFLLNVRRLFKYVFFRRRRRGFDFDDESMFFDDVVHSGVTKVGDIRGGN